MQKLVDGYMRFRSEVFPEWKDRFHLLAESQSPKVLFITCSDSRVIPSLIVQSEPGDMFVCRNAGNVVPPHGAQAEGVSATIEYAVNVLKVEHIVICGHSDCGAVRAAAQPESMRDLPLVQPWVGFVEQARIDAEPMLERSAHDVGGEFRWLVCANVVGQLSNLRTQRSVAMGLAAGDLSVHGWYYDIPTGSVEVYFPAERRFIPLGESSPNAA